MRFPSCLAGFALMGGLVASPPCLADCVDYSHYPHVVGAVSTYGECDLATDGQYVYVAAGNCLQIVDLSDASNPKVIGSVDTPGGSAGVAVSGSYAYLACYHCGLMVVDVRNPRNPRSIGSAAARNYAQGVAVSGNRAYLAEQIGEGEGGTLEVIDITDPALPKVLGGVDVQGDGFLNVAVTGGYAYVAANRLGLEVMDVRDPADPRVAANLTWGNDWVEDVAVTGDIACVAAGDGVKIVDITTPEKPQEVSQVAMSGFIRGISVIGNQAYVAESYVSEWVPKGLFAAIDVSDPKVPTVVGTVPMPDDAYDVVLCGDYACVADITSGLQVVDAANLLHPPVVYGIDLPVAPGNIVIGDYAYVTGGGFMVIDVSDPANAHLVGSTITPGNAAGLAISGAYAYVADQYPSGLCVIDARDPRDPSPVGFASTSSCPFSVVVSGHYAYVAGEIYQGLNPGALEVIDVSDPENPVDVAVVLAPSGAYQVAVSGGYAYVRSETALEVFDVTDPRHPQAVGGLAWPNGIGGLTLSGDLAYFDDGSPSFNVIDLSNPRDPRVMGSIPLAQNGGPVSVSGACAYVAGFELQTGNVLQVIDIQNPSTPRYVGQVGLPGSETCVAARDPYVYVGDAVNGGPVSLKILDAQCPDPSQVPEGSGTAALPLLRCQPNPSAGRTTIRFYTGAIGTVQPSIYDATGRLVRRLSLDVPGPGDHELMWDGRDQAGRDVASGVYLVRISARGKTEAARVVILK